MTADNQKAQIEQGTEIPYVTPGTANNPATVTFKKAVLSLVVTPQITPDNRIIDGGRNPQGFGRTIRAHRAAASVPSIDTKNVMTQITVNNGDTAVIGGIYEETSNNTSTRCRSWATSRSSATCSSRPVARREKTELLIFLTPRVVKESMSAVK